MDLDWIECDEAMDVLQQGQSKTAHLDQNPFIWLPLPVQLFCEPRGGKRGNTGFSRTNKSSFGPPIAWINTTQPAKGWRGGIASKNNEWAVWTRRASEAASILGQTILSSPNRTCFHSDWGKTACDQQQMTCILKGWKDLLRSIQNHILSSTLIRRELDGFWVNNSQNLQIRIWRCTRFEQTNK